MKKHLFIFFLRFLLVYVMAICTAKADNMCALDGPKVTHTFDFGNIVIPPNAKVGDLLAYQNQGNNDETSILCYPGTGTIYWWMVAPWMTPTSISDTYATNIPGVGIQVGARGGAWWFTNDGHPAQFTQPYGNYLHMNMGYITFYVIKTGDISNGGSLTTGLVANILDQNGNSAVDVILGNATISLPACNFNDGNPIDVDFGSAVAVTDVAAGTVEKSIDYTLTCTYDNFGLKMKILGTGASFDNDLLQTDINEMGIKFTANGTALPLNTDLNFASAAAKPALKAILTQQPGARLPTGAFTASATMRVEYQ